jgi:hypothetical protein
VIKYVSGICLLADVNGAILIISFSTVTRGVSNNHAIALSNVLPSPAIHGMVFGQPVKVYADPGTNVVTAGNVACTLDPDHELFLTFSGLLVNP